MFARLIAALHRWAESGWAGSATALWEFLQSSVVPGPRGAVFAPLAVSDPPRAPWLASRAVIGAIVGGCVAYLIGWQASDGFMQSILSALGMSAERIASSRVMFERHGWMLVFASTISPLSTKLTCIAAGAFGMSIIAFLPVLIIGRLIKFAALTVILRFAGEKLQARLARRHLPPRHPPRRDASSTV